MADAEDLKARIAPDTSATTRKHVSESVEISAQISGRCETDGNRDAVEDALADALRAATAAGQWEVVTQIATELQARRIAKSTNVISIKGARRTGGEP